MPRYTQAYSSFIDRLEEVSLLQKLAAEKERIDPIKHRNEINAQCRGALVLLCAHLEAFIKELGELALDSMYSKQASRASLVSRTFYHISKNFIDEIKDTSDPEKIGDKLFSFILSDLDFWSKSGPFPKAVEVNRFNKGFSNPAYKKIKSYFNRFGYSDYHTELVQYLNSNSQITIHMVDQLVDIRNKIAHGDYSATKTPSDVKDIITIVQEYCRSTDIVFANWWKSKFCTIR